MARHLQKGMAVLLRTEEDAEDESGWHKPWSIARVNMCAALLHVQTHSDMWVLMYRCRGSYAEY